MNAFEKDLYRYHDTNETFRQRLFRPLEVKYIHAFRKCKSAKSIFKLYYRLKLIYLSRKTQIQIPYSTEIGEGLYIGHCGRIIINPRA